VSLTGFLQQTGHWRVLLDLALLALSAGLYSVPMYALVQWRSPPTHRARIIAANNILNALFMIVSAGMVAVLTAAGFTLAQVLLITGILNVLVAGYIFLLVPEYLLRFSAWLLSNVVYRFKVRGSSHIPLEGAAILAANHVSFADAVLLMSASPRPVYFLMDYRIFQNRLLGGLFRLAKAIPIAPKAENPALYEQAMQRAQQVLAAGDILGIFPEGGITRDGQLQPFKGGIMRVLEDAAGLGIAPPVIPVAIQNMWGSYFSRIDGAAMCSPFRRGFWARVGIHIGAPMAPTEASPEHLHTQVQALLNS
jgi:1-acyl-sn-glycerol-3-phosphate acyltransferase